MRISKARFIVLALLPLALQPVTLPIAAGAGRGPIRCNQACQEIQVACDDRSDAICLATFAESEEKYVACRVSSKTLCLDLEQECRQICFSSRDGQKIEP